MLYFGYCSNLNVNSIAVQTLRTSEHRYFVFLDAEQNYRIQALHVNGR